MTQFLEDPTPPPLIRGGQGGGDSNIESIKDSCGKASSVESANDLWSDSSQLIFTFQSLAKALNWLHMLAYMLTFIFSDILDFKEEHSYFDIGLDFFFWKRVEEAG